MVVTTYDSAWNVLSETSIAANGVPTGDLYAGYELMSYETGVSISNAAYVGVASESAGEGECWILWMSADAGTSYVNDVAAGAGWAAETFGVGYCLD